MRIAIMGFGTVGCGAYRIAKAADGIDVARIYSRRLRPEYQPMLEEDGKLDIFTTDPADVWTDPRIDLVIESMGGVEPAREYVLNCLNAHKHVVTPNKNLISACYDELKIAAYDNGVQLRFTATSGGGVPWLFNLNRTKRCDSIREVRGIINGTCNYILDEMYSNGDDFDKALIKAQKLGYAEADNTSDVEGLDTLRKTVISANVAFDTVVDEGLVPCEGIDKIERCDIDWFNSHGYVCKLLMTAKKLENGMLAAYVEPALFRNGSMEAAVRGSNNLITLVGESIGTQSFYGQGAGMLPTGESVMQDVIDIRNGGTGTSIHRNFPMILNNKEEMHSYYVRYNGKASITQPMSVVQMHELARAFEDKGVKMFFAAIYK